MHIGGREDALAQVQVFLDAVPALTVNLAAGKDIVRGACGDGYVGDNKASVVGGQVLVQGVGQDAEVAVEEEDDEEGEDGGQRHLDDGADLYHGA